MRAQSLHRISSLIQTMPLRCNKNSTLFVMRWTRSQVFVIEFLSRDCSKPSKNSAGRSSYISSSLMFAPWYMPRMPRGAATQVSTRIFRRLDLSTMRSSCRPMHFLVLTHTFNASSKKVGRIMLLSTSFIESKLRWVTFLDSHTMLIPFHRCQLWTAGSILKCRQQY